ncbi:PHD finger domain-containing protein [Aspergillus ibericus CBS 121593]|uniref:Uncharacterized protein n=1 Tax=Aspergillus ibericus CBS 121593 TaxID=1448316 RepID=A0A395HBJ1_9EURO|nr:hypothetical protein BO80DRAFT_485101 [Aspergillus ibericus CBS 121593]RAL04495.1 hypothetical protein BO80DRAFT_485101 [Aspergillus ibericus CBS 121593]
MVTRGLWNLRVDGKWYRSFHPPRGRIASPDTPATLDRIRKILSETNLAAWECVPFPSPLHIDLDYVYNIDKDLGLLTVVQWTGDEGVLSRMRREATLTRLANPSLHTIEAALEVVGDEFDQENDEASPPTSETLTINMRNPTPLNELQLLFLTDFIFLWKFYLDDMSSWRNTSLLFRTLAIGILRIAAWDFEVRIDTDTTDIPLTFSSVPSWKAPSTDIFWFHGFLITLHGTTDEVGEAISKAQAFLNETPRRGQVTQVILMSLSHIRLVEISSECVRCSSAIPIIVNTSAMYPSPGCRVLSSVLSSYAWKDFSSHGESWRVNLPSEIFDMVLETVLPRDLVTFAQASLEVEKWYYSSVPQLDGLAVRGFNLSIPCCGKRDRPDTEGISCSTCYTWYHAMCVGLGPEACSRTYVCSDCEQHRRCDMMEMGGIYDVYRKHRSRPSCKVTIDGLDKTLQLRTSKPARRRPELWLYGRDSVPAGEIKYSVFFGGMFSGLAYGFEGE